MEADIPLVIWYHATTKAAAPSILDQGFAAGTYFAEHLSDLDEYREAYIFEVAFPNSCKSEAGWQMLATNAVAADRIVRHYILRHTPIYYNEELGQAIEQSWGGTPDSLRHSSRRTAPSESQLRRFTASLLSTYGYLYAKREQYEVCQRLMLIAKQILEDPPRTNVMALWEDNASDTDVELTEQIDSVLDQVRKATIKH